MGRTKQRKSTRVDDSDDDTLSTTSSAGASASSDLTVTQEVEKEQDEDTILEGYIDSLYEKRASTREAGLKGLTTSLTANVLTDFVEQKYETLVHQLIASIKRGSSSEAALASRALGLVAITSGAGEISEHILEDACPHLTRLSKLSSSPVARISAVEALAILTFVGGVDSNATENVMEIFWQIYYHKGNFHADQTLGTTKPTPQLKAAAISAWSLLLSTLSYERVVNRHLPSSLPVLSTLLNVQELDVRKAAGEAIALLYETTASDDSPSDGQSARSLEGKQAEVVGQIKALAIDASTKGQTKKERSEQRSSFKEMLATIEEGVCKETSIKLQYGDVLKVNTWTQTVQLNALRRFLAEGFQKHMQGNTLLHEIFDFVPRIGKQQQLSAKQKRLFMSPNSGASKMRTQIMNRKRSLVEAGRYFMNENAAE